MLDDSITTIKVPTQAFGVIKDSLGQYQFSDVMEDGIFFPASLPLNASASSYYWVKLTIYGNPYSTAKHVLEIGNPKIEIIEFYRPINATDYEQVITGTVLPLANREYHHLNFVFDVNLNYEGSRDFIFRIKSKTPITLSAKIKTQAVFSKELVINYLVLGLFYGTLVLLLFFSLLLFFTKRQQTFVLLSYLILSGGFVALVLDGSGFLFLWNGSLFFNDFATYASTLLILVPFVLLARVLLNIRFYFPKLDQAIITIGILYLVISTVSLSVNHPFLLTTEFFYLNYGIYALPYLLILLTGVLAWEKKIVRAKDFTIGFTVLLLCFGVQQLAENGLSTSSLLGSVLLMSSLKLGFVVFLTFLLKSVSNSSVIEKLAPIDLSKDLSITDLKMLQTSLLPTKEQLISTLGPYFVLYKPKKIISGNYYFVSQKNNLSNLVIINFKGGDWLTSLAFSTVHQIMQELSFENSQPDNVVKVVQDKLTKNSLLRSITFDIGAFSIDRNANSLSYYSQGIYGLGVTRNQQRIDLAQKEYKTEMISKDQKLYFFTNGLANQLQQQLQQPLTNERVAALIQQSSNQPFGQQYKEIKESVEAWQGAESQTEDWFVLGLKI